MPAADSRRRLLLRLGGAAIAAATFTAALVVGLTGDKTGGGVWPPVQTGTLEKTVLSLLASRDIGRLPERGTGAGQDCGSLGSLGTPEHCWRPGTSGDDLGTVNFDLAANGVIRTGVVTGIPAASGTGVSFASETGAEFDGTGNYRAAAKALAATTAITISYIASDDDYLAGGTLDRISSWGAAGLGGYIIYRSAAATVTMTVYGSGGTKNLATTRGHGRGCMTWAVDLTNANNSRVHKNGVLMATADGSGGGSMAGTNNLAIGGAYSGTYLSGGLSRFRIDYAVGADAAAQLANHVAFCGTYAAPLVSTHVAYADTSWTQSGASRCFATSATAALCWPGGRAAYRYDGAVQRWAVEDSRTNRLTDSAVLQNWTVTGNPELLTDGDMEAAGVGAWTAVNAATLTKEAGAPHGGALALGIAYNGTANPGAGQTVLTTGSYYTTSGWFNYGAAVGFGVIMGGLTTACTSTGNGAWKAFACTALAASTNIGYRLTVTAAASGQLDDLTATLHSTPVVDPAGGLTAYLFASTATLTSPTATGYTNGATLYPRVWLKCTGAGTVTITNPAGGTGNWTVNCAHATLSGNWAELHKDHAAVTVVAAWTASGAGAASFVASSTVAYSLWVPTLTEVDGYSVIPTDAAAGATGDIAFAIANATGVYWKTGDAVTQDVTTLTGTCWVTGATLYLSGAVGSECTGMWSSLEVVR